MVTATPRELEDRDVLATEEEARQVARRNLMAFTRYSHKEYWVNWHHRLIARKLDQFIAGKIKRLIITAPPRTGKSELVSRRMPAAIFGRNPKAKIISTSHGAKYASKLNRDVQRIMLSPEYKELYPDTRLSEKRVATMTEQNWLRNSTEFEIVGHGGYYMSAGVGGGIAGYGADYIIVDDPLRHRKDANSPLIRERIWEWFNDDLVNLLDGDGGILVMATRFHEDDLIGRLLREKRITEDSEELDDDEEDIDGEKWQVLNLPARVDQPTEDELKAGKDWRAVNQLDPKDPREVGDILWPWLWAGKRSGLTEEEMIAKARRRLTRREKMSPYGFSALFQQRPTPKTGKFFMPERITIVDALPANIVRAVRYWDKAGTEGGGKYTAGVKMARLANGQFAVLHVVRGQWSAFNRENNIRDTAKTDGKAVTIWVEQEPGSGGKESAEGTISGLAGFVVRKEPVTGAKETRAEPYSAQVEGNNVIMLRGDWNAAYKEELRHFPLGTYSDQTDASSGAFNKLAEGGYNIFGLVKPLPNQGAST